MNIKHLFIKPEIPTSTPLPEEDSFRESFTKIFIEKDTSQSATQKNNESFAAKIKALFVIEDDAPITPLSNTSTNTSTSTNTNTTPTIQQNGVPNISKPIVSKPIVNKTVPKVISVPTLNATLIKEFISYLKQKNNSRENPYDFFLLCERIFQSQQPNLAQAFTQTYSQFEQKMPIDCLDIMIISGQRYLNLLEEKKAAIDIIYLQEIAIAKASGSLSLVEQELKEKEELDYTYNYLHQQYTNIFTLIKAKQHS